MRVVFPVFDLPTKERTGIFIGRAPSPFPRPQPAPRPPDEKLVEAMHCLRCFLCLHWPDLSSIICWKAKRLILGQPAAFLRLPMDGAAGGEAVVLRVCGR